MEKPANYQREMDRAINRAVAKFKSVLRLAVMAGQRLAKFRRPRSSRHEPLRFPAKRFGRCQYVVETNFGQPAYRKAAALLFEEMIKPLKSD